MCKLFSSITSQLLGVVLSGAITPLKKKKMPGCAAETLWKERDPEADAAGRAASVQWFINHKENKQVVRQARVKTRTRSKENKSERVEERIQSAKQKHKKGKVNKTQVQLISRRSQQRQKNTGWKWGEERSNLVLRSVFFVQLGTWTLDVAGVTHLSEVVAVQKWPVCAQHNSYTTETCQGAQFPANASQQLTTMMMILFFFVTTVLLLSGRVNGHGGWGSHDMNGFSERFH